LSTKISTRKSSVDEIDEPLKPRRRCKTVPPDTQFRRKVRRSH